MTFTSKSELIQYADRFVKERIEAYRKDMRICLLADKDKRHAYMPALLTSVSLLELFSGLYAGKLNYIGTKDLISFSSQFMNKKYYSDESISILYEMFRHKVAHVSQPYSVFDSHKVGKKSLLLKMPRRLITWQINACDRKSPIDVVKKSGCLYKKPPWAVPYTHKCTISLYRLKVDICRAALGPKGYLYHLQRSMEMQNNFEKCMVEFYPQ